MDANVIWKFKWFWAWNDDKEEAWLQQMSLQGWHLHSFGLPGFYTFEAGGSRNYYYRLDFQMTSKNETAAYLQLFTDAGWEYVGSMSSWNYFRKEARPGEAPEIFTDNASKVQKYRRLVGILLPFLPIYIVLMINLSDAEGSIYNFFEPVAAIIMLLYAYALLRLLLRIRQLKGI